MAEVARRIFSGSVSSWMRIVVTLVAQLLVVPFYISEWSVEEYGVWLVFMTGASFLQLFDSGFQNYIGNKFLMLGKEKIEEVSEILFSSLPISLFISLMQTFLVVAAMHSNFIGFIGVNDQSPHFLTIKSLLIAHSLVWGSTGATGGLLVKMMNAFHYFSRFSWWGVLLQTLVIICPVVVALLGGHVLAAGISVLIATLLINLLILGDIFFILKQVKFPYKRPNLSLGITVFFTSLWLTFEGFLNLMKQQGVRFIVSGVAGVVQMASFSTTRTVSNLANQGLATITNPVLPELMAFIREKNREKVAGAFAVVWLVVVAALCPGLLILQLIMEPFFLFWTRHEIQFSPMLFGTLSISILLYATAQPPTSIVRANNLLRNILTISVLTTGLLVMSVWIIVSSFGVEGTGWAFILAEFLGLLLYIRSSKLWLYKNDLVWPARQFFLVILQVVVTSFAIFFTIFSSAYLSVLLPFFLALQFAIAYMYCKSLPKLILDGFSSIFQRIGMIKIM